MRTKKKRKRYSFEQNHQLEHEQRQRQIQTIQTDLEQQIETLKSLTNEEHARIYNEIRVFFVVCFNQYHYLKQLFD